MRIKGVVEVLSQGAVALKWRGYCIRTNCAAARFCMVHASTSLFLVPPSKQKKLVARTMPNLFSSFPPSSTIHYFL
jgi:hypothetical protein